MWDPKCASLSSLCPSWHAVQELCHREELRNELIWLRSIFEPSCAGRSALNWAASAERGGRVRSHTSTQNFNFLIFQGGSSSDLGGNETSAMMAIRTCIVGSDAEGEGAISGSSCDVTSLALFKKCFSHPETRTLMIL